MYYNGKSKLWKMMNHIPLVPNLFLKFCVVKISWQLRCLKQWNESTEFWDGWLISS